jgi:hypothetical protein
VAEEVVQREELSAALAARRELGPEYEDAVVEAFVDKIERRLEERMKTAPRRHQPSGLAVPLGSLGIAIPLLGVAGGTAGIWGVVVVCIAIVVVNLAYAAHALRR